MKKIIAIVLLVISLILVGTVSFIFFGSGFTKRSDVYLNYFSLDPEGDEIDIIVDVASSAGFTREAVDTRRGDSVYVSFYSAFGGVNGRIDADNSFDIDIYPDTRKIYFDRGNGEYDLVLQRNESTGEWEKTIDASLS